MTALQAIDRGPLVLRKSVNLIHLTKFRNRQEFGSARSRSVC